jgi:hypothetical protein
MIVNNYLSAIKMFVALSTSDLCFQRNEQLAGQPETVIAN